MHPDFGGNKLTYSYIERNSNSILIVDKEEEKETAYSVGKFFITNY